MQIDWFTYGAQIFNFLILVWLLVRFLYEPITRAMDQRKQHIKASLDEAEEKRQAAEKQLALYEQKNQELAQIREQMLVQAREAAEEEKQKLLKQVRQEAAASEARWYEALLHERQEFLHNLHRRISQEITRILRRTLADLANVELEAQIVAVFIQRLEKIEAEQLAILSKATNSSQPGIVISSAFQLSSQQQQAILATIQQLISAEVRVDFETVPDLLCGISLLVGGQEITWNLDSYLHSLEENITTAIEQNPPLVSEK